MAHHPAPRRALLAAALLLLAPLAACSSDGGSEGAPADDGAATTTSEAASTAEGAPLDRFADYESVNYDDPSHWVCSPAVDDDICDGDLDATLVAEDGTLTVEPFVRAEDPPIDCFYVYPTISRDDTQFADWDLSDEEEGYVTLNQAARLQSVCRLFAPGYRQLTLGGLGTRIGGEESTEQGDPYADVLDAFRTYLAEDNGGRGFVLVGHSQGAGILNRLIAEEIDPEEDLRSLLVGAYLAGGAVAVPEGEVVGGDFADVPLCTADGEVGCVTTWATFRDTAPPPPNSFFGAPRGSEGVAGCVNPAAPAGGPAALDSYFPANAGASILDALGAGGEGVSWLDPSAGTIETPFVHLTDLVTGACAEAGGFHYLEATVTGAGDGPRADDIPGDLSPEWGLHLVDVNLVMGDVVRQVAAQAKAVGEG
ncbi:MAG: DUF3089 domain-containing protein [Acidimicrobiales bacterium]